MFKYRHVDVRFLRSTSTDMLRIAFYDSPGAERRQSVWLVQPKPRRTQSASSRMMKLDRLLGVWAFDDTCISCGFDSDIGMVRFQFSTPIRRPTRKSKIGLVQTTGARLSTIRTFFRGGWYARNCQIFRLRQMRNTYGRIWNVPHLSPLMFIIRNSINAVTSVPLILICVCLSTKQLQNVSHFLPEKYVYYCSEYVETNEKPFRIVSVLCK